MHCQPLLRVLMGVYSIEGRLSVPKPAGLATSTGSDLCETLSTVKGDASLGGPQISLASPLSKCGLIATERRRREEGGGSQLDMTLDLVAPQLLGLAQSVRFYLWHCEVEDSLLAPLCTCTLSGK